MLINTGTKDQLEIAGYKQDKKRKIVTIVLCVLTGGLLLLLLSWKPSIRMRFTSVVCPPGEADVLLVKDIYGEIWEERIEELTINYKGRKSKQKYFYNKKIKYIWDEDIATFTRISFPPPGTRLSDLASESSGLTDDEAKERKHVYGENTTKIEMPTIWQLFISQAYNPFYIFQVYTIILWCVQAYYLYSGCIFFLSVISITLNIWETRKQTKVLREKMITESTIKVIRNENIHVVDSKEVVPGDVVLVEVGAEQLEADIVLLEGSTIMNEAILTGESLPITKVQVPQNEDTLFHIETHKKHILYSGTKVLQVRGGQALKATVIQTGYDTVKGEMIRSILFPKPLAFHIYSDFLYLFFILVLIGIAAMIWSLVNWASREDIKVLFVIIYSIDLLTFVVPPILPATITAINLWSQKRLQMSKIFCLSSNYISLAGPVDIVCFDKTGTLTEEDFSLEGIVPCENGEFYPPLKNLKNLSSSSKFGHAIATCHSVAKSSDGSFIGHPLDIKLFSALGWNITDSDTSATQNGTKALYEVSNVNPSSPLTYQVLKTYPFVSGEQRMTVIAKGSANIYYEIFIKGAPERIESMCSKESVPDSYPSVLEWYTRQGLRIIAAASKPLSQPSTWEEINRTSREHAEQDAIFLGLIILQNRLKPETFPALQIIHEALISTVMVTGDNLLTAANIARQCGLVKANQQVLFIKAKLVASSTKAAQHLQITFEDSNQTSEIQTGVKSFRNLKSVVNSNYVFGIDGEAFKLISQYDKETFTKIVHRGKIFARMKPDQKTEVIEALQQLGHQVAMCGDGCNDCGALKAAHSGISLSSTEASVAAPFTSLQRDIGCVATLLREGRATLVSTYISFKYNISCCFLALIAVLFSFSIFTHPSNMQYLIMDLVLITIPSLFIGNTKAASDLCQQKPTKRFVHPLHIFSIISFLGFQSLYFWVSWQYLESQSWYKPFVLESVNHLAPPPPGYELTVTVTQVFFAFIVGAVVFSHDFPFRKHFFTNKILTIYLILSTILCIVFTFCQTEGLYKFLDFKPYPYSGFTWTMFLSLFVTSFICYSWERWFLYGFIELYVIPWIGKVRGLKLPYEVLEASLRSDTKWPKLDQDDLNEEFNKNSVIEIEDDHEDPHNKPHGFFRRLTKKYKFDADVIYESELNPLSQDAKTNGESVFQAKAERQILNKEHENDVFEKKGREGDVSVTKGNENNMYVQIRGHSSELAKENLKTFGNSKINMPERVKEQEIEEMLPPSLDALRKNSDLQRREELISSTEDSTDSSQSEDRNALRKETDKNNEDEERPGPHDKEEGLTMIKEMNETWAIIRSSLHESMKDFS